MASTAVGARPPTERSSHMLSPAGPSTTSNTRAAAAAGLRLCLRSAAAEAHARLDHQLGSLDLTILPGYRQFLEINAAGLIPLEAALTAAGAADIFPDCLLRSRESAILEDLARVG